MEDLVHGLHRHGRPVQLREHKAVLRLQELPPVPQKGLQLRRKICLTMPDSSASWHTALAEEDLQLRPSRHVSGHVVRQQGLKLDPKL